MGTLEWTIMRLKEKYEFFKDFLIGLFKNPYLHGKILIIGNQDFVNKTTAIIEFLKKNDFETYNLIEKYLKNIVFKKNYDYITVKAKINTCFVGEPIVELGPISYAVMVTQQAYYLYQYDEYLKNNPKIKRVPDEKWCAGLARKKAIEFRKQVLINLNAPAGLIELTDKEIQTI